MTCSLYDKPAKPGPKLNPDREFYAERYGLMSKRKRSVLTLSLIQQLDACKNESARRLIMGQGRRSG